MNKPSNMIKVAVVGGDIAFSTGLPPSGAFR